MPADAEAAPAQAALPADGGHPCSSPDPVAKAQRASPICHMPEAGSAAAAAAAAAVVVVEGRRCCVRRRQDGGVLLWGQEGQSPV